MNWIDLIVIFVLALFIWNGYHKGLIRQMGDLLLLVASFVISFAFYGALSTYLAAHFNFFFLQGFLGKLSALVLLWVGTQVIFYFLFGIFYHQLPEGIRDSKINKSFEKCTRRKKETAQKCNNCYSVQHGIRVLSRF